MRPPSIRHRPKWSQRVFSKILASDDQGSDDRYHERKSKLFKDLSGKVLEIGPGTGVNLSLYPKDIYWIGIEPNSAMHSFFLQKALKLGIRGELKGGYAESLLVDPQSIDAVVSTQTLCSVKNVAQVLSEIRRVLKPGGRFYFLEHVLSQDSKWRRSIQHFVKYTPWRFFSDGCHPDRDLGKAIFESGFKKIAYEEWNQEGPGIILWVNRPHICGIVEKR